VLKATEPTAQPRIIVLEGREALGEVSRASLEESMRAINSFVRSDAGRDTLVVWPTNTDNLTAALAEIATSLGAEALFGIGQPFERFSGPPKSNFVSIAAKTVAALNEGASLATLGISDERASELTADAPTIGRYLALVRRELISNGARVRELLAAEQARMWVLVAAPDAEGDVGVVPGPDHDHHEPGAPDGGNGPDAGRRKLGQGDADPGQDDRQADAHGLEVAAGRGQHQRHQPVERGQQHVEFGPAVVFGADVIRPGVNASVLADGLVVALLIANFHVRKRYRKERNEGPFIAL
jgi:hypothetical protein